jgi:hypothetical protein
MTDQDTYLVVTERMAQLQLSLRGQRVLLDFQLAELYGVSAKRFNERFRRNLRRFPADFAFQLTEAETEALGSQFSTLEKRRRTYAFTVLGACMAAMMLDSSRALEIIRGLTNLPLLLKLSPHRFHS